MLLEYTCLTCHTTWAQQGQDVPGSFVYCTSCGGAVDATTARILDYEAPIAVVIFSRCGDTVLSVSRRTDHNAFGLPGGKVDDTDGPMDNASRMLTLKRAAVREFREETGVTLTTDDIELRFDYPEVDGYHCFYFEAPHGLCRNATSQPNEGIVAWCSWDTLEHGPFSPTIKRLKNNLFASESEVVEFSE